MKKVNLHLLVAWASVLVTSACLSILPTPAPVPATPTPNLALTGRVQTLTAAPTPIPTETPVLATETSTITLTPFPSITPLPTETPTATQTPIGYVETATPAPTALPTSVVLPTNEPPDSDEGYSDPLGSDYACKLISKTPLDWTQVQRRSIYKVSWTLMNTGRKVWDSGIKLVYVDGQRMGAERVNDLKKDVKRLANITQVITIQAPNKPERYRAVWGLRVLKTGHLFCLFTVKIEVP